MGTYFGEGNDTSTASTTIIGVSQPATALKRLKVGVIQVGSDASADSAYKAYVKRHTATGTSTSFTPTQRDTVDGAASAVFGYAHTVEPTYTANSQTLTIVGHQRSTYQWYAAPGHEIIVPVTNSNGVDLFSVVSGTAFNMVASMEWEE